MAENQKKQVNDYLAEINRVFKICEIGQVNPDMKSLTKSARTINKPVSKFFNKLEPMSNNTYQQFCKRGLVTGFRSRVAYEASYIYIKKR